MVWRGLDPLDQQVGGHDRTPAAAARRIHEAADQAQRRDPFRALAVRGEMEAAPDQVDADRSQVELDEGLDDRAVDIGQQIGAGHAADHAGNDEPGEQAPVDIAVQDMADRGHTCGEGFGGMDAGGSTAGRHAHGQQQGAGNHAIGHAKGAIDNLRAKADQDEGQYFAKMGDKCVDHPNTFVLIVYLNDWYILRRQASFCFGPGRRIRARSGKIAA